MDDAREGQGGLHDLVAWLREAPPDAPASWGGWDVEPVAGGANGRVFRARGRGGDVAVKLTARDERDRAGREHAAMSALAALGLDLAPAPLLLARDGHGPPAVASRWLPGEALQEPPADEAQWSALVEHYLAIHAVTPGRLPAPLPAAVLTADTPTAARGLALQQVALVPPEARPPELAVLAARLEAWAPPPLPAGRPALIRCDPNVRNMLWGGGRLRSVDWENAGLGDPAFEVADLLAHPSYLGLDEGRRAWLAEAYARGSAEPGALARIRGYRPSLLVWWVARLARTLHEVPRGGDVRLAPRPPGWQRDAADKLARYAALAAEALREVGA